MADAAVIKREARRRRILENSENRLKRITGLYNNAAVSESNNDAAEETASHIQSSNIPSSSTKKSPIKQPDIINNVESFMESPPAPENVPVTNESLWQHTSSDIDGPPESFGSSSLQETNTSGFHILCLKARFHIIILAMIVRILLTLPYATLFGESALVPLCTVEFAEWLSTKLMTVESQDAQSGFLGIALMLSGIPQQRVTNLLGGLQLFNRITQDFCIYFFVLFLTHAFLQIFSQPLD